MLLLAFVSVLATLVAGAEENNAFVGILNGSLLIKPPLGGSVSVVNFTDAKRLQDSLTSVNKTMESFVNNLNAKVVETEQDLLSALERIEGAETGLFKASTSLEAAFLRILQLEIGNLLNEIYFFLSFWFHLYLFSCTQQSRVPFLTPNLTTLSIGPHHRCTWGISKLPISEGFHLRFENLV